jgi:hypothetical protein
MAMFGGCGGDVSLDTATQSQPFPTLAAGSSASGDPAGGSAAGGPDDYVVTPAGSIHRSCVHELPSGATVDEAGHVTLPDGSTYQLPPCQYPKRPDTVHSAAQFPVDNNWVETAIQSAGGGGLWRELTATWRVPGTPGQSYTSSQQVFYTFPGLQSSTRILQPVLQYTSSGWQLASWSCDTGTNCPHSSFIAARPNDLIFGSVLRNSCNAAGTCSWTINTLNQTTGQSTSLNWSDAAPFTLGVAGAIEVYGLDKCQEFPAGSSVVFSQISLFDQNMTQVSPTWINEVFSQNPNCNFSTSSTSTTATLGYAQCAANGSSCSGDGDCCNGYCDGGVCQAGCAPLCHSCFPGECGTVRNNCGQIVTCDGTCACFPTCTANSQCGDPDGCGGMCRGACPFGGQCVYDSEAFCGDVDIGQYYFCE